MVVKEIEGGSLGMKDEVLGVGGGVELEDV